MALNKIMNIILRMKGAKKAKQDLKGVDSRLSSLGKNALKAGAAFFAARGIINAFKAVVGAAAEQELAEKKLGAVLKSTSHAAGLQAGELKKLASSLQKTTMYGDETIIGAQSLMLTFTKIGKDVFPDAIETVLNMSTAMGTDLQSSVIQLGKALNAPVEGISALSRVGVQLTEDQKNQIKSFMEVNDVASAQKVILGELETQFGGMAEAAGDTAAGAMAQMKNALGDTAEVIGSLLAPAVTNIAKGINSFANAISKSLEPQKEQLTQTQLSKIEIQRLGRVLEIYSEKEKLTANETQHRADTIRKLNKLSPKYLGHLDSEKTAYEDIEDAIRSATTHLKEQIKVEAGREVLLETNKEVLSIERQIMDIERSLTVGSADLAIAYDWQATRAERVAAATRLGYEHMDLLNESTVIYENLTNQAAVGTELFAEDIAILVEEQIKLEEETQELLSRMPELATFFNKLTEETTKQSEIDKKAITHTIKKGQWLSHLAGIYKVSVEDIKEWNGMTSDSVEIGDELIVGFEKTTKAIKTNKGAVGDVVVTYKSWVKALEDKQALNEQESGWITQLIEDDIELAKAMGFVEVAAKAATEATYGWAAAQGVAGMAAGAFGDIDFTTFDEYVDKLYVQNANLEHQKDLQRQLIEQYPELAEAMGVVSDEMSKAEQFTGQFSDAMVQAVVHGQDMEEAVISALKTILIQYVSNLIKTELLSGAFKTAEVAAANVAGTAVASAWATPAALASTASFGGAAVAGLAGIATTVATTQALALMHEGGLVGGQGDTPIMAQSGEFVLSRSAVQDIGVDTAQRINQGGGAGITVNINAPLVDETVRDSIIPAIQKAQRLNLA